MLEIRNIKKSFGSLEVLKGVDFKVDKGEVVAILGPSGSGKTTLLRCISFLDKADSGTLIFGGQSYDLSSIGKKDILSLRMNMGFVFQTFNLFRNMTALKNVTEGLCVARKMPKEDADKIAIKMLDKVGLSDRANYYPDQLSGGQQQRVAIARAIATNPKVILFDEPTSALDPELTGEVLDVIKRLAEDGTTMVIVTHEMEFAKNVANRVIFMDEGYVVEEAPAIEFFNNPREERALQFIQKVTSR